MVLRIFGSLGLLGLLGLSGLLGLFGLLRLLNHRGGTQRILKAFDVVHQTLTRKKKGVTSVSVR